MKRNEAREARGVGEKVRENARVLVRGADPVALLKATAACDGHTIFDGAGLAKDCGLHVGILAAVERVHVSGSHPKDRIGVPGTPGAMYEQLRGVYGLELLMFIADALEIKYPTHFIGRGFQAQAIQREIYKYLGFENGALPKRRDHPRCPKHPKGPLQLSFQDWDWSRCGECGREQHRKTKSQTEVQLAVRALKKRLRGKKS